MGLKSFTSRTAICPHQYTQHPAVQLGTSSNQTGRLTPAGNTDRGEQRKTSAARRDHPKNLEVFRSFPCSSFLTCFCYTCRCGFGNQSPRDTDCLGQRCFSPIHPAFSLVPPAATNPAAGVSSWSRYVTSGLGCACVSCPLCYSTSRATRDVNKTLRASARAKHVRARPPACEALSLLLRFSAPPLPVPPAAAAARRLRELSGAHNVRAVFPDAGNCPLSLQGSRHRRPVCFTRERLLGSERRVRRALLAFTASMWSPSKRPEKARNACAASPALLRAGLGEGDAKGWAGADPGRGGRRGRPGLAGVAVGRPGSGLGSDPGPGANEPR